MNALPILDGKRELHLFAGCGGGILGSILLGHTCVCAVEIEPYCRKVLFQRQRDGILPKFPIWDDVRTFDGKPWRGLIDIIAGGFPCQDISMGANSAGGGKGLAGERSGLWMQMERIISEVQPRFVFIENSPLLSYRGLARILCGIARMGYDARWGTFRAADIGFDHLRKRMFVYAYDDKDGNHGKGLSRCQGKYPMREIRLRGKTNAEWETRLAELVTMDVFQKADSYAGGRRILHGMANAMDRIGAIGNGQVLPVCAALAWRTLSQVD